MYVYGDSKLVINQVLKNSNCESPLMDECCQEIRKLEGRFRGLELHHIPRKHNPDADALAKMAAERKPAPSGVFINDLNVPSACERQPATDKAKIEETENAQKTEHAPSDPAPN